MSHTRSSSVRHSTIWRYISSSEYAGESGEGLADQTFELRERSMG
jgi:hypothetical protein